MPHSPFSRREFLKLAALGAVGLAGQPLAKRGARLAPWLSPGAVLTPAQQYRLHQASLRYLAPSPPLAREVALAIDFIEGRNEDPANMCGPLSIEILKEAELLGQWVSVHDFWLMNPDDQRPLLEDTFPAYLYDWHHFDSPFSEHDFADFPLQAGDFIYLYAGPSDTFEHIFVVTHLDAAERSYTVSNFLTPEGMLIEERMLQDPAQPGVGQVWEWANRQIRNTIGITGGGGYSIWRVKDGRSLEFPQDWDSRQLRASLNALLDNPKRSSYAWIEEIGGPLLFQYNPYERFHPTSTIKVPIALAFYAWLEEQAPADEAAYLAEDGTAGRSFAQLLEAMIVDSEEDATQALTDFLGAGALRQRWDAWGLSDTQIDPRRSSSRELRQCFLALWQGDWISPEHRRQLLDLMAQYTVNDDRRLGLLKARLPQLQAIYNKRGSLTSRPQAVADSGILDFGQRAFYFSVHLQGGEGNRYEDLEADLDLAILAFGRYLAARLDGRPYSLWPA